MAMLVNLATPAGVQRSTGVAVSALLEGDRAYMAQLIRERVPLCATHSHQLERRYGSDHLCKALWGISCDAYGELVAAAAIPDADPCAFLIGNEAARRLRRSC